MAQFEEVEEFDITEWADVEEPYDFFDDDSSFEPLPPPMDTPFSFAVSLGGGCFVAKTMQLNGFRVAAGPFDYMVATPSLVAHCLDCCRS